MNAKLSQRFERYGPQFGQVFSALVLLSAPEIAELTGLSQQTVYKLMASGELKSRHFGRSVRAALPDVLEWIESKAEE